MHHILAEIIQGGLVLETNVEEISATGRSSPFTLTPAHYPSVRRNGKLRKESFASANPLALGVGSGLNSRGTNLKTPLGWLTTRLTGVGAR